MNWYAANNERVRLAEERAREIERERRERERKAREIEARSLEILRRAVRRRDVDGLRLHAELLFRQHKIRPTWLREQTSHERWCAYPDLRQVRVPLVDSPEAYATVLHEVAHVLSDCPGTFPHEPHVCTSRSGWRYRACIECEAQAWRLAMRLALEWTPRMHEEMQRALHSYRNHDGPFRAHADRRETMLNRTRCRVVMAKWREEKQRRVMEEIARESQRRVSR